MAAGRQALFTLVLGFAIGCGGAGGAGDLGGDGGARDFGALDLGGTDRMVLDAGRDLARADGAQPDLGAPDLLALDLAPPDLAMPDLARPDLLDADLASAGDASLPPIVHLLSGVTVSTLAGSSTPGELDATGGAAQFDNPVGIASGPGGELFVTEYDGDRVRVLTSAGRTGTLTAQTGFVGPFAVIVLDANELLVQTDFDPTGIKDDHSGTLWRVPFSTGVAAPLVQGLGRPRGLALLASGLVAVSDREHDTLSLLDPGTGTLTPLAGTADEEGYVNAKGSDARFADPIGLALLPDQSILVADSANHCVRRVQADGTVTTFAGAPEAGMVDGTAAEARFARPGALAVDAAGELFVSDLDNHRLRRVNLDRSVVTVAGDGVEGFRDGAGETAEFYGQEGLAVTPDGKTLYVTDGNRGDGSPFHRVRVIAIP